MISRVSGSVLSKCIHYQVNTLILYYPHTSHMLCSEIDLHNHPQLRLLQLRLNLENEQSGKWQDNVIQWFNTICDRVTSRSLVIEVGGFPEESKICDKIQNTLLAMNAKVETFSVHLSSERWKGKEAMRNEKMKQLFSRLWEAGIAVTQNIQRDLNKCVGHCILIFYLPS